MFGHRGLLAERLEGGRFSSFGNAVRNDKWELFHLDRIFPRSKPRGTQPERWLK